MRMGKQGYTTDAFANSHVHTRGPSPSIPPGDPHSARIENNQDQKIPREGKTNVIPKPQKQKDFEQKQSKKQVLARSDARHVVVLGQRREVLVQLLDALLVSFGAAFAF